jgi:hypothetical protein
VLEKAESQHETARQSLVSLRRRCAELEAECAARVPAAEFERRSVELERALAAATAADREHEAAEARAFDREKRLRERIARLEEQLEGTSTARFEWT